MVFQPWIHEKAVVGPFQCNCHLLVCPTTGDAAVVDPGDDSRQILQMISKAESQLGKPIQIKALLHTHAHLDHIGATRGVVEGRTEKPKILLHQGDGEIYRNLRMQAGLFGMEAHYGEPLPVDQYIEDGEVLRFGSLNLEVVHTPGHSPGGVCYRLKEDSQVGVQEQVFSGDTLFQSSIGRTDLWGGDVDTLLGSIRRRLFTMDDEIEVHPGHGDSTSIGRERRENPFLT